MFDGELSKTFKDRNDAVITIDINNNGEGRLYLDEDSFYKSNSFYFSPDEMGIESAQKIINGLQSWIKLINNKAFI